MIKIIALSDLHGNLINMENYSGDICIIAGDIIPLNLQTKIDKSIEWLVNEFTPWCKSINVDKVVFIAGNHDFVLERQNKLIHNLFPINSNIIYLKNELYYFLANDGNNYKIFGSPYCKIFGNWPFMRTEEKLKNKFDQIPNDIDILVTHDVPYGTNDVILQKDIWWATDRHVGNKQLKNAIEEKKPRININGHIHSASKIKGRIENTEIYNCSILDEKYEISYLPQIINLEK